MPSPPGSDRLTWLPLREVIQASKPLAARSKAGRHQVSFPRAAADTKQRLGNRVAVPDCADLTGQAGVKPPPTPASRSDCPTHRDRGPARARERGVPDSARRGEGGRQQKHAARSTQRNAVRANQGQKDLAQAPGGLPALLHRGTQPAWWVGVPTHACTSPSLGPPSVIDFPSTRPGTAWAALWTGGDTTRTGHLPAPPGRSPSRLAPTRIRSRVRAPAPWRALLDPTLFPFLKGAATVFIAQDFHNRGTGSANCLVSSKGKGEGAGSISPLARAPCADDPPLSRVPILTLEGFLLVFVTFLVDPPVCCFFSSCPPCMRDVSYRGPEIGKPSAFFFLGLFSLSLLATPLAAWCKDVTPARYGPQRRALLPEACHPHLPRALLLVGRIQVSQAGRQQAVGLAVRLAGHGRQERGSVAAVPDRPRREATGRPASISLFLSADSVSRRQVRLLRTPSRSLMGPAGWAEMESISTGLQAAPLAGQGAQPVRD
ncbi:hypothetical protein GGTG_04960 [Gaeumannomyces tritici R3-111a-1]|uniref:Uncharacterized protein n=1 Tax=Gaeumannomyces tritici (strain R3-111a-1) TaxID=644352 RepID=J3NUK4_GAET3|nr:hypothetical protein GGTG_04960 [Gaeumannomyces tritici R3-111a-1]EJT79877.1 hypothetical protein GGTG_04960 [Gaeumannomyces tritici R3-111a-1]